MQLISCSLDFCFYEITEIGPILLFWQKREKKTRFHTLEDSSQLVETFLKHQTFFVAFREQLIRNFEFLLILFDKKTIC
jgi:hypothetical protein